MYGDNAGNTYGNKNVVSYDYGTTEDKKSDSSKAPRFNGDPEEFSWWKANMYNHIMGLDKELWDILENGVGDMVLDEEGATIDRNITRSKTCLMSYPIF